MGGVSVEKGGEEFQSVMMLLDSLQAQKSTVHVEGTLPYHSATSHRFLLKPLILRLFIVPPPTLIPDELELAATGHLLPTFVVPLAVVLQVPVVELQHCPLGAVN